MQANNEKSRLVLILKEKINWELFFALCNDLINATMHIKNSSSASKTILQRLRRWHEFLKNKRLDVLTEEKIKGLIGELTFILKHLIPKYGSTEAVRFWIGPKGSPQDFSVNDCAIEVKCQLSGTYPNVKISSADQLFSQLSKLYLFVITLGKSPNDNINIINLPSLIAEITHQLENETVSLNLFQDKLMETGYYYSEKYLDYNYLLLEEHIYEVTNEFPRICPNDLKQGIINISYNINLEECTPFELELAKWELCND